MEEDILQTILECQVFFPEICALCQKMTPIQDNFMKYSPAIPLSDHQARTIAVAFVKKFNCIFESGKGVLSYQGRDFVSNLIKKLAKRFINLLI